jgi:hypothetical protein
MHWSKMSPNRRDALDRLEERLEEVSQDVLTKAKHGTFFYHLGFMVLQVICHFRLGSCLIPSVSGPNAMPWGMQRCLSRGFMKTWRPSR